MAAEWERLGNRCRQIKAYDLRAGIWGEAIDGLRWQVMNEPPKVAPNRLSRRGRIPPAVQSALPRHL